MRYKYNPKTARMEQVTEPDEEIVKSLIRKSDIKSDIEWDSVRLLRPQLAVCRSNSLDYLCVEVRGQWRCCGVIKVMYNISKHARGPLANFRRCWLTGVPVADPRKKEHDSNNTQNNEQ